MNDDQWSCQDLELLKRRIRVQALVEYTTQRYPDVISEYDVTTINLLKRQERAATILLELFQKAEDGFRKFEEALKATDHPHEILTRTLGDGSNNDIEEYNPATTALVLEQLQSLSSKIDTIDAKNIAETKEIEKKMEELSKDFISFKKDTTEKIDNLSERIASLEKAFLPSQEKLSDLKKDVEKLEKECRKLKENRLLQTIRHSDSSGGEDSPNRERSQNDPEDPHDVETEQDRARMALSSIKDDLKLLNERIETIWKSIISLQDKLSAANISCDDKYALTRRSTSDEVQVEDISRIAKKVSEIWRPLATEMGVQYTEDEMKATDGEGSAVVIITKWLEQSRSDDNSPPTWGNLCRIISRRNESAAEAVDNLR